MPEQLAIEAAGLRRSYGPVEALRGLDLRVSRGSIHGFLGRNGAGKTTTIKILLGMTRPSAGEARVFGLAADDAKNSLEIRSRAAFVSEDKDLYEDMTVAEMIRFTASFYQRWRPDLEQRYLRVFELPADRKVKQLSRGMRTKLALLLALCRGAELLILDEPTSGLDPAVSEEVLQALVAHVGGEEMTVFFSSHQISEVEQISDHVTMIERGRTVLAGAVDDLRANYRRIQAVFGDAVPQREFEGPGVVRVQRNGRTLIVMSSNGTEDIVARVRALNPVSVDVMPVTLKEIFLETIRGEA